MAFRKPRFGGAFFFFGSLSDWNPGVLTIGVPMVSADRGRVSVMAREKLVQDFGPKLVALRDKVYEMTEGRF